MTVADGEDAKIVRGNGTIIYRQAKKREGSVWSYDKGFAAFVERAFGRFKSDHSVHHEFHTNQAISSSLRSGEFLNPEHAGVKKSVATDRAAFCASVRFVADKNSADPRMLRLAVEDQLRTVIDKSYPGCQAQNFVTASEISALAAKLQAFETLLWRDSRSATWLEVDRAVGLDALIADLLNRSLAGGALEPFENCLSVAQGGPDTAQTAAIEAARAGKVTTRTALQERLLSHVDEWWAGRSQRPCSHLVVILVGGHGTGKTWTLLETARMLSTSYPGLSVSVAVTEPPGRAFSFSELGIAHMGPCAVVVDELLPDWLAAVANINAPPFPLLVLGTAARGDRDLQRLERRLGRRVRRIEVPDHLELSELEELARVRGVSLSNTEKERVRSTNIRGMVQLLTGVVAADQSNAILELLQRDDALELLGPILFCSGLRLAMPRRVFERAANRAIPADVRSWIVGAEGTESELWAVPDAFEARRLLVELLGAGRYKRLTEWCATLVRNVDHEQTAERAFARRLLDRLAREHSDVCAYVLEHCQSAVDAVMSREPLWALASSWLPAVAQTRRQELIQLALSKITAAPTTLGEVALLLECYGVDHVRDLLAQQLVQLDQWNPSLLATFISALMRLDKDDRRDTAVQLTSLLTDLPREVFEETLRYRSTLQEATNLAADFGKPHDRHAFLSRVSHLLTARLAAGSAIRQNSFEALASLTERVVTQSRFGASMAIARQAIIHRDDAFQAREYFQSCYEAEQAIDHSALIGLGLRLVSDDSGSNSVGAISSVAGKLLQFAGSWLKEGDRERVVDAFIDVLGRLATRDVSFDRISSVVLPCFAAVRAGPRSQIERFIKALLHWLPSKRRVVTEETVKLLLHFLGLVAGQAWSPAQLQQAAKAVLLGMVRRRGQLAPSASAFSRALRAEIGVGLDADSASIPDDWLNMPSLAQSYLIQVGRLRWTKEECAELVTFVVGQLDVDTHAQPITEALLRFGEVERAQRIAERKVPEDPEYPDWHGYLAIASARLGDPEEAERRLAQTADIQDKFHRGLHPHLVGWVHTELASVSSGRIQQMHLLCAELARRRPLRKYEDVVSTKTRSV